MSKSDFGDHDGKRRLAKSRRECPAGEPYPDPAHAYSAVHRLTSRHLARCHFPGWQFTLTPESMPLGIMAFRKHPETGDLERLGPWPLPMTPGEDEVRDLALAAVVTLEGDDARERFAFRSR